MTFQLHNEIVVDEIVSDESLAEFILVDECPRVVVSNFESTTLRAFKKTDKESLARVASCSAHYGRLLKEEDYLETEIPYLTVFKDQSGELVGYLLWAISPTWYNDNLFFIEEVSTGNIKKDFYGMARLACEYLQEMVMVARKKFPDYDIDGVLAGVSQPDVKEQVRNTYEKKNGFHTLYQFYKEIP